MRVLIINEAVPEAALGDCDTVRLDGVGVATNGNLLVEREPSFSLADVDAVVIDLASLGRRSESGPSLNAAIRELVGGGELIVCVAGYCSSLAWLPATLVCRTRYQNGRNVVIEEGDELFSPLLVRFRNEITYDCDFEREPGWNWLATTKTGYPIAAYTRGVVVLPRIRRTDRLLGDFFRDIVPRIIPHRAGASGAPEEDPPEWLAAYTVPGMTNWEGTIGRLGDEIAGLQEEQANAREALRQLADYQGLLWKRGKRDLEPIVRRALEFLGVPCDAEDPYDAIYRGPGGPLIIEIEGSANEIQIDKGRQLSDYIMRQDDPADFKGAIIGNPFRQLDPAGRPPENRTLFSTPLEKLASRYSWPLITTFEIFELVRAKLARDDMAEARLRIRLGLDSSDAAHG